jgi:hypothetical protein
VLPQLSQTRGSRYCCPSRPPLDCSVSRSLVLNWSADCNNAALSNHNSTRISACSDQAPAAEPYKEVLAA